MADTNSKRQPKRKRTYTKKAASAAVAKQKELEEESVDSIFEEIKSEDVDDPVESENNSKNLMVLIENLKREEDFIVDDSSSSQDVSKGKSTGIKPKVGGAKGGKKAGANAKKGKQKTIVMSPSELDDEDSSDSEFADSMASHGGNSKASGSDSESDSSEVHSVSDTEDSSNDVTVVEGEKTAEEVVPKKENEKRYPFRLSQSDYEKFTQNVLKRNFNLSNPSADSGEPKEPEENGEEGGPAKKARIEVKNEAPDQEVNLETLQQTRLERLNKLNEAIDFIKDILAKLAEKERFKVDTPAVKTELDEAIGGETEEVAIKEEAEEIKSDTEMEAVEELVA